MSTIENPTGTTAVAPPLPATLRLGPVHLTVSDLDRSIRFYERSLGLRLQRHLLLVLLLWIERWYDATRTERREPDDADVQLYRRFDQVLERDFARHHDAVHYADALAVPPAALSQALNRVTGRSTKELVTDRVMLEAARLLRFTDRTIGEIAFQAGFGDPLYFSRAFKRHHGHAPTAYRSPT